MTPSSLLDMNDSATFTTTAVGYAVGNDMLNFDDDDQVKLILPMFVSMHCEPEQPRIQTEVLGHSLVRSLVRSHLSLTRALRCAHLFACLLTPSLLVK